ncbi:MAG: hypothetical protein KF708_24460 [Pirellulales bacterium]|nr:hypothetical protein [Pirellulales bacterium]
MYIVLLVLLFALFIGVFASTFNEGLWSNALTLFNLVTAALLAMNFFEPLASFLDKQAPGGSYYWDIVALWGIFGVSFGVMRTATDFASRVRVRFFKPVDVAGSVFFAIWIGWVTVCFALATMHTAPLSRNFLSFRPEDRALFNLAPDRQWLAFTQKMSLGQFSRMRSDTDRPDIYFDPKGDFMLKYASRREEFEKPTAPQ